MKPPFAPLWENEMQELRSRAAAKCETIEFWWSQHYGRPLKDPLLQEYTYEELWEEFLAVQISKDPSIALLSDEDTVVQFKTGDKKVDELEERIAAGEDVDLLEALMDPAEAKRLKEKFTAQKQAVEEAQKELAKEAPDLADGFDDTFVKDPSKR